MGIEQDVKQTKFSSEFQKAMVNILFTSSWLGNRNTSYFKKFDISPEQFNVLRILRGSHPNPMRLADIAERMIERNSNCTRLVEKLRQKRIVNRQLCETNRRQVDISITSKGLKILEEIDQDNDYWTAAEKKITKVEARELNRILDKLRS
ncbi:MAG: MarR family transcriptional regulator [Cyclobacteriaceae bacterium]